MHVSRLHCATKLIIFFFLFCKSFKNKRHDDGDYGSNLNNLLLSIRDDAKNSVGSCNSLIHRVVHILNVYRASRCQCSCCHCMPFNTLVSQRTSLQRVLSQCIHYAQFYTNFMVQRYFRSKNRVRNKCFCETFFARCERLTEFFFVAQLLPYRCHRCCCFSALSLYFSLHSSPSLSIILILTFSHFKFSRHPTISFLLSCSPYLPITPPSLTVVLAPVLVSPCPSFIIRILPFTAFYTFLCCFTIVNISITIG